jgi:hypothetical protein
VIFRRKRLPDELVAAFDAFHLVLEEIEPAKAQLTDVVPGSRLPGSPLDQALGGFLVRMSRADALMPAWRRPELEPIWSACAEGLEAARSDAAAILAAASEPAGFGDLLAIVERLVDRLEPFAEAEARFAELRRRKDQAAEEAG